MADTSQIEARGLKKITDVVVDNGWGRFMDLPGGIDTGIDGVIIWNENRKVIGMIYVQSKSGASYLPVLRGSNYEKKFRLQNMTKEYVQKHYLTWQAVNGPVIIVVTNENGKAWWADLKKAESYNESFDEIWMEPTNLFNKAAFFKLQDMVRKQKINFGRIHTQVKSGPSLPKCLGDISLKKIAKQYYVQISKEDIILNMNGQPIKVKFSRVGWRHMTRRKRRTNRIIQSFLLLPLAKTIIENTRDFDVLDVKITDIGGQVTKIEKIGIKADCSFGYRFPSVIQVILLYKETIGNGVRTINMWFYSVYETRRYLNITDTKKP